MIQFELPFAGIPKGRPRVGRGNRVYTPAVTRQFESKVRLALLPYRPSKLLSGAISLTLDFVFAPPQRPKNFMPIVKPDLDNLLKAVTDAMNGIIWEDDAQVVECRCFKYYDYHTKRPRILGHVQEIEIPPKQAKGKI